MTAKPEIELNLLEKLNEDEQTELQRRLLAIMEQMFLEGISTGRELNREELHVETEKFIQQKIAFLTNYFLIEKIWSSNPPAGYDPKRIIPKIEKPEVDSPLESGPNYEVPDDAEEPEWAKKDRPFG